MHITPPKRDFHSAARLHERLNIQDYISSTFWKAARMDTLDSRVVSFFINLHCSFMRFEPVIIRELKVFCEKSDNSFLNAQDIVLNCEEFWRNATL